MRALFPLLASLSVVAITLTAGAAAAQQTVATQYGDVTVPADPQRVVVLSEDALDAAVAVGVTPVAALARRGGNSVPDYLAHKVPGIQIVGTTREMNVEAIVASSPDLILAGSSLEQAQYDILSQLAPTIVPLAAPTSAWRDAFVLRAQALGKASEGEAALAAVEEKAAEVKAAAGDKEGQTAAIIRWMEAGPVVFTWKSLSGQTLASLGFEPVPLAESIEGAHTDVLSLENLTEVDADWLVIAAFGETGKAAFEAMSQDPIYQTLRAVKSGQVIITDGNLWSSSSGPLAAIAQLDDVLRGLAPQQ